MENYIQNIIIILQSITDFLDKPFWLKYDFYLGIFNLILLAITLYFLIKYTSATQGMKEEMIKQRVLFSANNIDFKMTKNYLIDYPGKSTFGELKTPISHNTICSFEFLNLESRPIGRCSIFYKKLEKDNELCSNYFIDDKNDRELFLKVLKKQGGTIKAKVITTDGSIFLYTLKATGKNWEKTIEDNQPNLNDEFILIKKIIAEYE